MRDWMLLLLFFTILVSPLSAFLGISLSSRKICCHATPNSILFLPLAPKEALFPGQTSGNLILKEGRWFDLLDEAVEDHENLIGTPLMGPDGLLPILPICEIEHYELSAGYRGKVTATIQLKGVGRAKLMKMEQMKPCLKGQVEAFLDDETTSRADMDSNILQELEALVQDCGRIDDFTTAYHAALGISKEMDTQRMSLSTQHFLCHVSNLTNIHAASWAAMSLIVPPSQDEPKATRETGMLRYQALSTINAVERLTLAMASLLEETSFQ